MIDPKILKELRNALRTHTLLYVEDNISLNKQATQLFQKFFDTVYSATDSESGLELFKKHHSTVVISEIHMLNMDGFTLAREILQIDSETKIILMMSRDDPRYLHEALKIGAFDCLAKPISVQMIVDVLKRCAVELRRQMHQRLFNLHLHNIFNYQQNLVLLLHTETVVIANQPCLEFFGASSVEEFQKQFFNFGDLFLPHSGFLYNHNHIEWLRETKHNPGKLYNVKIAGKEDKSHHFVLSLQTIPEKEDYYVLSLNDVTELNLLKLFDANAVEKESVQNDKKALLGLLEMAKRNNAKIKLHNLYKGLSITNDAIIHTIDEGGITIKTTFMQLKAIQFEKRVILVSDIFPMFIESNDILGINFDQQTLKVGECKMASSSPIRRQYIRVPPNAEAKVTLLYQEHKFDADIELSDISIKAVRLKISSLPAGFKVGEKVILDIVLGKIQQHLIINTEAEIFRIIEQQHHFEVVFMYDLHGAIYKQLIDYIAKQQMYLIREFRGMQYGQ